MVARKITSYSENNCNFLNAMVSRLEIPVLALKLYTALSTLEIDIGDEVVGDKLVMLVTDLAD